MLQKQNNTVNKPVYKLLYCLIITTNSVTQKLVNKYTKIYKQNTEIINVNNDVYIYKDFEKANAQEHFSDSMHCHIKGKAKQAAK